MKFEVMSRENAIKFSQTNQVEKNVAIISISNMDSEYPQLLNNERGIKAVLLLKFDDEEIGNPNCIKDNDATGIVNFVNAIKDNTSLLIVHCAAGQSRSAGVCAAIMKYLTNDDMPIFSNGRFTPNMTCYRKVLNAFHMSIDEEELSEKEDINMRVWKKLFDEETA